MRLSFDDEESFKEVVGSLRFHHDNPPSDPNSLGQVSSTTPSESQESREDIDITAT
jgi:hypothetical protein